jgi:ribosomal protein S18 acetylase RimI-like enzyme
MGGGVEIRPAGSADIPHLAELFLQSSRGVVGYLYQGTIPGRSTNVIVEHLFTRFGTAMSFANCQVAEQDGNLVGAIHSAPSNLILGGPADLLVPEDRKRVNASFGRLRTPDAFHIVSVGVVEDRRGRGIGELLMKEAEARAVQAKLALITLNVAEENAGAVRLYQRLGYREAMRERVSVPGTLEGDVIHMTRMLTG